jgi:hypothetical protein
MDKQFEDSIKANLAELDRQYKRYQIVLLFRYILAAIGIVISSIGLAWIWGLI